MWVDPHSRWYYDEQAALGSGLMGAGMAIMTKPFDISAFSAKVQDLLQH
jgi:hypothetical protein